MAYAVDLQQVGKRYGSHWVLKPVDLKIDRGETVAIFGKNGSGKSTLLKILSTLISPSCGKAQILDHDISKDRFSIRKLIRFLGHEKQLYGGLTVVENLSFVSKILGCHSSGNFDSLLSSLGLTPYRDKRIDQLSEGNKKRVVMAKLLLHQEETELIILDEPHPTLDEAGKKILDQLISSWKKENKTLIIASHDHDYVLKHASRLLTIDDGRLIHDEEMS